MLVEILVTGLPLQHPLYQDLSAEQLLLEAPDAHYQWHENGQILARASIWYRNTPQYNSEPTGIIGHFHFSELSAGVELLSTLKEQLLAKGFPQVVGPMNGNSWFNYRLAMEPLPEPAFTREPWQPDDQKKAFKVAGFHSLEHYCSNTQKGLDIHDDRLPDARKRLQKQGIRIVPFNPDNAGEIMLQVYQLCCESFAENPFYQPITFDQFDALYSQPLAALPAMFCQLAYQHDELVGFIFSYPDESTLIVKTVAVKSGRAYAGLSNVLMDTLAKSLPDTQFSRVIYALMHINNQSRNVADRYGIPFRRYAMMGARE